PHTQPSTSMYRPPADPPRRHESRPVQWTGPDHADVQLVTSGGLSRHRDAVRRPGHARAGAGPPATDGAGLVRGARTAVLTTPSRGNPPLLASAIVAHDPPYRDTGVITKRSAAGPRPRPPAPRRAMTRSAPWCLRLR